jgi:hypothetical protein
MKVDCEHSDWKEVAEYSYDSSSIYYQPEIHKDSLHILLGSSYSIIESSKHGSGAMIAFGPPLLPLIPLIDVSYAVLENGFTMWLLLQYCGDSATIDFSRAALVLPDKRTFRPVKLSYLPLRSSFQVSKSFIISPPKESMLYKIEFELTNSEILKNQKQFQVIFPTLIELSGDSICIPPIKLVKDHSFKYYPFVISG